MLDIQADVDKQRMLLVTTALGLCGSHYLFGATQGSKPGDATLDLDAASSAAKLKSDGSVCAGRFLAVGGKALQPGETAPPAGKLTARTILGYSGGGAPTAYPKNDSLLGSTVLGEKCDGKWHFDCGGFVRHVGRKVCGCSIDNLKSTNKGGPTRSFGANKKAMGRELTDGEPLWPGDVLYYKDFHHLGFAYVSKGKVYKKGSPYPIIQAEAAAFGCNAGKVKEHDILCVRLTASALMNQDLEDADDEFDFDANPLPRP